MTHTFDLAGLLGETLRGKLDGRKHFGLLCTALSSVPSGSTVRLDFSRIKDVSASWIAAAALPLLTWSASIGNDLYPVLVGVLGREENWEDEFDLVAHKANTIFLAEHALSMGQGVLLGILDPILADTLQLVQRHRQVTGAGLKRLTSDAILATAWSNRLRDLHTMRLVKRVTRGREQVYSAVLEVNLNGPVSPRFTDRELPATNAT